MGSIVITGASSHVSRSANLPSSSNFTIAGWVKRVSDPSERTWQYLESLSSGSVQAFQYYRTESVYRVGNDTVQTALSTQPSSLTGVWMYAALQSNGTTQTVRLWNADGSLIDSESQTTYSHTPTRVGFGAPAWGSDAAEMRVAYGRVWDAVLTQEELEAEMFSPSVVRTSNFNSGFIDSSTLAVEPQGSRTWTTSGTSADSDTPPVNLGTDPTISDAGDESYTNGETGIVITGTNFGASQGTGKVLISPTNDPEDSGAVEQTVTEWSATSITFTAVKGTLSFDTVAYLFVINDSAGVNASGHQVQIVPRVWIRETLVDLNATPVASATGLRALIWRAEPTAASPNPSQVLESLTTNGSGVTAWEINRGALALNGPIWLAVLKDGSPARATMRKITPSYE